MKFALIGVEGESLGVTTQVKSLGVKAERNS